VLGPSDPVLGLRCDERRDDDRGQPDQADGGRHCEPSRSSARIDEPMDDSCGDDEDTAR